VKFSPSPIPVYGNVWNIPPPAVPLSSNSDLIGIVSVLGPAKDLTWAP